jgi:hypothetical protein
MKSVFSDFANGSSLRLVSSAGSNFAINAASTIDTGITGVASSNSVVMPTAAPPTTALHYLDTATDTLKFAAGGFNSPTITAIGALGIDALNANGFELLPDGRAFAALNWDAGTSLATGIYSIDTSTGMASLLGPYNGTLSGLTVAAIPEPSTYVLMFAGLAAMGLVARRRRNA